MVSNNMIRKRINAGVVLLAVFGLVAGLRADEIALLRPKQPAATRTLSFPSGQWVGTLCLEPESGPGWNPEGVTISPVWEEYLSAARGDVRMPEDRNVQLWVRLALNPRESAKLRAQNPRSYQQLIADRVRKDPDDLSGLSELDPNDLFWLYVSSRMYQRTGTDPRMFEPISRLTGLRMLSLTNTGVTDEGLEHLRSLRSLRALMLTESSISSRALAVLRDLPALEYLDLYTGVTDAGLKQVGQHPNLRWLRIRTGRIWGPGLGQLANMPSLERLCIWGTSQISDRHMKYLEGLTQLKSLTLWGIGNALTDASLASIGKLKNLEELHFIHSMPRFTVAGVARLKGLKNLKKLDFAHTWISPGGMRYGDVLAGQLAANFPNLESIKGIGFLSAEGMKTLTTFRNLKCLHVTLKSRRQGYYGPTGVSHLASLGSLEEINISSGDALVDVDMACLESLARLKDFCIFGQNVTQQSIASIGKLKQLERLTILFNPATCNALNQLNGLTNLQHLQVTARAQENATIDTADEQMLDLSGLRKMKKLSLSGLPLQDSDLAFLEHLPLLKNLAIQPDSLTGASLRYLRELPELNRLFINRLSNCTGEDLAYLNALPKLRSLTVSGDITDAALASLTGPLRLESLHVHTDAPIREQTVADLTKSLPVIEFIHINDLPKVQTRPVSPPKRTRVSQTRTNRRTPASPRRERR